MEEAITGMRALPADTVRQAHTRPIAPLHHPGDASSCLRPVARREHNTRRMYTASLPVVQNLVRIHLVGAPHSAKLECAHGASHSGVCCTEDQGPSRLRGEVLRIPKAQGHTNNPARAACLLTLAAQDRTRCHSPEAWANTQRTPAQDLAAPVLITR